MNTFKALNIITLMIKANDRQQQKLPVLQKNTILKLVGNNYYQL